MQLNRDQNAVVSCDNHCLVVAGPGSGKTRVITIKTGHLLQRHHGARVVAVTFTRESAAELSHRVTQEIGPALFKSACRFGTFHSLAIRQLRNHNKLSKVASPGEQAMMLRTAISLAAPSMSWEEATSILEAAKGSLEKNKAQASDLYKAYSDLLKRHKVCDLYDVIRDAVVMMRTGDIRPYPANFMFVDEFQDTDEIQLAWVLEHAKAGTIITTVGDDDQSIYGFRGALGVSGMEAFANETGATRIVLGQNYRCRKEILSAADKLIQNNYSRIAKDLAAARGPGGAVQSSRFGGRDEEADAVVTAIAQAATPLPPEKASALFSKTVPAGSWAVLCRNNRMLDLVEKHLQDEGIQCYRPPKESYWSRAPQSVLLALIAAIDGGNTAGFDLAIEHALKSTFSGGEAKQALRTLHSRMPSFAALLDGHGIATDGLMAEEAKIVSEFAAHVPAWRRQMQNGRINMAIRAVTSWFAQFEDGDDLKADITSAGETLCRLRGSVRQRVNALTSFVKPDGKPQGVQLQTMHGSKGLEFNNVWIIGTENSTIPSSKSSDHEEERRLMYVAMTRAKDWLMLSSVMPDKPSQFVEEAGLGEEAFA